MYQPQAILGDVLMRGGNVQAIVICFRLEIAYERMSELQRRAGRQRRLFELW